MTTNNEEPQKISETQAEILRLISKHPYINAEELSKKIGKDFRKTKEQLKKLQKRDLLERIGGGKGGYWDVIGEYRC